MRAALLASFLLLLIGCSHGAPAPAVASVPGGAAVSADAGVAPARLDYPVARKVDVVDDYHGTKVADPYRWLEDPTSPGYREWITAENALTEKILSSIPARDAIRDRLTALWNYERYEVPYREDSRVFYEHNTGLQNQSVLYVVDLPRFEPRILLDMNTFSKDGTTALTGTAPSMDGKLLAYGVAATGSDWQEWRVRDVETGQDLPDRIQWAKNSGAAWTADNRGFYYTRFDEPRAGEQLRDVNQFQKLYYHRLGTPQAADRLVHQQKDHPDWEFGPSVSDDGRWLVLHVYEGTDPRNGISVQDLKKRGSKLVPLTEVLEAKYVFVGSQGPVLWFRTTHEAPRGKIIAIDTRKLDRAQWRTLVPEAQATLVDASAIGQRFVLNYLQDVHSEIEIHTLDGKLQEKLKLPFPGTAKGFYGRLAHPDTYFSFETYASPAAIIRLEPATGEFRVFRAPQLRFEPSEYQSQQIFYTSKDGTRVPMTLTFRKGTTPDGDRPVLLYGYGGFDISETPRFSPEWLAWMERGGVLAVAHIRGGGEYGDEWHLAGVKLKKQNVFDDFIAAAEWLIKERWTRPERLAIEGASNGGLLVGAVLNQRPDLFGCALPLVGVMDTLRYDKFTVGPEWRSDYGSVADPAQFKAILAYSPLQNIKPGTVYPATMAVTNDHDDRVVPAHSFKYMAALQAAQAGPAPVIIRIETRAAHGTYMSTTKKIGEAADAIAFCTRALNLPGGR